MLRFSAAEAEDHQHVAAWMRSGWADLIVMTRRYEMLKLGWDAETEGPLDPMPWAGLAGLKFRVLTDWMIGKHDDDWFEGRYSSIDDSLLRLTQCDLPEPSERTGALSEPLGSRDMAADFLSTQVKHGGAGGA